MKDTATYYNSFTPNMRPRRPDEEVPPLVEPLPGYESCPHEDLVLHSDWTSVVVYVCAACKSKHASFEVFLVFLYPSSNYTHVQSSTSSTFNFLQLYSRFLRLPQPSILSLSLVRQRLRHCWRNRPSMIPSYRARDCDSLLVAVSLGPQAMSTVT
eukprot:g66305.t1